MRSRCSLPRKKALQGAYGIQIQRSLFDLLFESGFNRLEKDFAPYLEKSAALVAPHRRAAGLCAARLAPQRVYPDFVAWKGTVNCCSWRRRVYPSRKRRHDLQAEAAGDVEERLCVGVRSGRSTDGPAVDDVQDDVREHVEGPSRDIRTRRGTSGMSAVPRRGPVTEESLYRCMILSSRSEFPK